MLFVLKNVPTRTMAVNDLLRSEINHFTPRHYKRVQVRLPGRYVLESGERYPCVAVEMSSADVLLSAPVKARKGEQVTLFLDELGGFAGVAEQFDATGFAMSLRLSNRKRNKLADQLTWFANRHLIGLPDRRQHERIVPLTRRALLRLPEGRDHIVKLIDLSRSGVSIETNVCPAIGTPIVIGKTPAVVVRHFNGGIACQFIRTLSAGELDESTRL
jgi:hypothetical protein